MTIKPNDIRLLRQRSGWSLAEMARQLKCDCQMITGWEDGIQIPDPEAMIRLQALSQHVEAHAARVAQVPASEVHMEENSLCQSAGRDHLV